MVRGTSEQESAAQERADGVQGARPRRSAPTRRSRTLAEVGRRPRHRAAREGDPARGEAHGGLPREADPAAHHSRSRRRRSRAASATAAAGARPRRRTHDHGAAATPQDGSPRHGHEEHRHVARSTALAQHARHAQASVAQRRHARARRTAARAARAHDAPAARPRARRSSVRTSALTGGAPRRRRRAAAPASRCVLAQSHRPRKPACTKSFIPAAANTAVTVRPAGDVTSRSPTRPSAVHAPTQRLHVTSSPERAPNAPSARALAAHRVVDERLAHPRADVLPRDDLRDREVAAVSGSSSVPARRSASASGRASRPATPRTAPRTPR